MKLHPQPIPTQVATLVAEQSNGKNYSGEKRLLSAFSVIAQKSDHGALALHEVVTVRVYGALRGNGSRNYVSLWANGSQGGYTAGHGWAGGWGYHRPSAAMQAAVESAGFTLSEPIDGRGETAMETAALAIARALGFSGALYIIRQG